MTDDAGAGAAGIPLPSPLSLIVCDQVVIDDTTGKATLLGTLSHIVAANLPAVRPGLAVYLELTGIHASFRLKVKIVYLPVEDPAEIEIMAVEGEVEHLGGPARGLPVGDPVPERLVRPPR